MAAGTPGATPFAGHDGPVYCVAFSPDGTTLATGGDDGTIRLWDPGTGQQTSAFTGHTGGVTALAWSPDGTIATSSHDGTIRLWSPATGRQTRQLRIRLVGVIAFSPDGSLLAIGDDDGAVRLWDSDANPQVIRLGEHSSAVNALALSPDGSLLATGAGSVRIWDVAGGTARNLNRAGEGQAAQLTAHTHRVNDVAWSPDGSMLASAGGSIRVWDTAAWRAVTRLTGHGGYVGACAWSPDGATLASANRDGTVRLWDTATWQPRLQLTGHTATVRDIDWSPGSTALASVGDDGTIRLWNPETGEQIDGTGPAVPRALAGVRSDSPSGEDLLGIGDDVETLAELIAATETRPPLAIALIGDWGTGKSSVMLQIERHIGLLAERAQDNPGVSAFGANVRQVRFNAWHYSDDHLWTGIVSHLFETLADAPEDPGDGGDGGGASGQREIAARRDRLRARLGETRDARDRLARDLESAEDLPRPEGVLEWLGSPAYVGAILLAAVRQAFRDTRAALPTIAAWAVLGVAAYLAWRFWGTQIAGAATVIAALTPPAVAVARKLRSGHDAVLRFAEDQRSLLAERQRGYDKDITELRDRLVLVDAAARLDRFLDDRGAADSYRGYRGLLGQVHADLRELSADLAQAREQWASEGGTGPPPLERIVLYIDDLDRCPPSRVVKVLDAVHLMLALDLFVVVVAVDARWLIRSLEYHHEELFRASGDDEEPVATPVDYLDKIFQLPFVLRPPAPDATGKYLRSLLPEPAADASATTATKPPTLSHGAAPESAAPESTMPGSTVHEGATAQGDGSASAQPSPLPGPTGTPDGAEPSKRPNPCKHPNPSERPGSPERHGPAEAPGEPSRSPKIGGISIAEESAALQTRYLDASGEARDETPVAPDPAAEPQPRSLQLSQPEIEFMTHLGGLIPTPRAAKRLVNLYRLVRIGIPNAQLPAFASDANDAPYRTAQVLLAILVGHPKTAKAIFSELLATEPADDEGPDPTNDGLAPTNALAPADHGRAPTNGLALADHGRARADNSLDPTDALAPADDGLNPMDALAPEYHGRARADHSLDPTDALAPADHGRARADNKVAPVVGLPAPVDDGLAPVIEKAAEADASFLLIRDELTRLQREQSLSVSAAECRRWCPVLARFSFYTRDLARSAPLT